MWTRFLCLTFSPPNRSVFLVKDPKTGWYVRAMAFLKKVDLKT